MSPKSASLTAPIAAPAVRTTWLPLILFCCGHFFVDIYSAALGVLQPLLMQRLGFNFTEAGLLAGVFVFSASTMQPVYGYLSDRFHSRLFSALGPAIGGICISLLGAATNYPSLAALIFLGGAGIGAFHPQGAASAALGVPQHRARAMAIFITAGTVGLSLGPTIFSTLTTHGLDGARIAMMPGILMTLLMLVLLKPGMYAARRRGRFAWHEIRAVWKPMLILYLLVMLRSAVQVTFAQFLPLYLHHHRGYTLHEASLSLTLYLLGGALGGLAGGNLADRFGGRNIILFSMSCSLPFLALFVFSTGALSAAGLFLGGLILLFTNPVNIVMAQELAPTQSGTVSALMMGFAWGMAGMIFIPLTGWISDHYSMQLAFAGLITFPAFGTLLALKIPKHAK